MSDLEIILKRKKFLEKARVSSLKDYYKHQEDRKKKHLEYYHKNKNKNKV